VLSLGARDWGLEDGKKGLSVEPRGLSLGVIF
jgi:hypothetical protein